MTIVRRSERERIERTLRRTESIESMIRGITAQCEEAKRTVRRLRVELNELELNRDIEVS